MNNCPDKPDENDGEDKCCCLHDLPDTDPMAPGRICCWCGDLFQPHSDAQKHGEYKPTSKPKPCT
jgi:hypothetical protein